MSDTPERDPYVLLGRDKWPARRPVKIVFDHHMGRDVTTIRAYPGGRRLLVLDRRAINSLQKEQNMSTITIGSTVRVRTGLKGRPYQATVTRLYVGTDVGVKFNSERGQDLFGTKQVRFGLDAVSLVS